MAVFTKLLGNKKAPSALEEERQRQTERKEENKQKIVKLLEERKEIKNDDVEKLLGVSSVTAFRYLEELEKKGEIEQVGKTGRSVTYKKT